MLVAAAAVVSLVAGCGGGSAHPLQTVRSAAAHTLSSTALSTLTLTDARLFGGTPGTIVGRAEYSFPRGLGYQTLLVPALGRRSSGPAYLVYQPERLWSKPVVHGTLPPGRLWISATYAHAPATGSTARALALAVEGMNPQLLLDEISTGAIAASSSGRRVVDHEPFTEYVVSVDLARALAAAPAGAVRSAIRQELAAVRAERTPTGARVRIVARVDGTGHLAQLQASLPGSGLGLVSIALRTFGTRIPLSLPPASETVDVASLGRPHDIAVARHVFTGE